MKINTRCPVCKHLGEDGGHLLGLETERETLASIQTAQEAVEFLLKAYEQKKVLMTIALWYIWSETKCDKRGGTKANPAASC